MIVQPRVLEIGTGQALGHAGTVLWAQGYEVHKWVHGPDDMVVGERGDELWEWYIQGKTVKQVQARRADRLQRGQYHVIVESVPDEQWQAWGVDINAEALRQEVVWVSLRYLEGEELAELDQVMGGMAAAVTAAAQLATLTPGRHQVTVQSLSWPSATPNGSDPFSPAGTG